ncbi:ABC transporter substrate-binding protein [Leptospira neocaledonica]|uniref:Peptide ABC transporter substrate-binding protein n=1 Tax=Leptospira neocaledonica TaxID=2023192 RepID=A0A2N0A2A9_9LEPT|nr:ABC transporter substrate-binding protein [Leptospira neocaledonica]PJZ78460.1 peptide ABC transporter substrate-binding protein [Leptospira neocaledonica]
MFYPRFLDSVSSQFQAGPKPTLTFSLAFLLLSLLFYGCGKAARSPEKLVFSLPSDPISLDPIRSTDLSSRIVLKYIYPRLFEINGEGQVLPSLVRSYKLAEGPSSKIRRLILEIHSDPKSNVSAQTVLDSLERLKNTPGPRKSTYSFLKGGKVLSDFSLEIYFEGGLREALEKLSLPQAWIYCGPPETACGEFKLAEWKRNNYLRLVANQSNDLGSEILFRVLPQASTGLYLYFKDELDLMKLPVFLLKNSLVKEDHISIRKGGGVQYVAINSKDVCFDKNFRKALNYSVDKRTIIQVLLEGKGEVSVGPFPKSISNTWTSSEEIYPYDLSKAKDSLSKSICYPKILERELEFRMRGDEENQANGAAIVQNLKELGLKIRILPMEKAALYKENGEGKGDLTLLFWYADLPGPFAFLDPLFAGDRFGNGGNRAFYSNPKMEKLFQEIRSTDKTDINPQIKEAFSLLAEDAPWIFLWSPYELYLIGDRLPKGSNRRSDLP